MRIAALVLCLAGCSSWVEVRSPHFRLRTDFSPAAATKAVSQLEEIWSAFEQLSTVGIAGEKPLTGSIDVVAFFHNWDFESLTPVQTWDAFFREVRIGVEPQPTVVTRGLVGQGARRVLQHELAHRMVAHFIPGAPVWLHEGLAQYFETFEIVDGLARFGKRPPTLHFTRFNQPSYYSTVVSVDQLPSLEQLLRADWTTFHEERNEHRYYAAAWALVHHLEVTPELRRRFRAYQRGLAGGDPNEVAFARAFAGVDRAALDRSFREEAADVGVKVLEGHFAATAPAAPAPPHALDRVDVRLLFATLKAWTRDQAAAVAAELDAAEALAPGSPEVAYTRAWFDAAFGRLDKAEAGVRGALSQCPDEPRYQLAWVNFLFERIAASPPPRDWTPLRAPLKQVWPHARSAESLNLVGWAYAQMGDIDLGLVFARRAVEERPDCWECLDTLALLLSQTGYVEEALTLQERAVALIPERRSVPELLERLERYRREVKAATAGR
jgi:tetratricopeptide (TPR) repeat protein